MYILLPRVGTRFYSDPCLNPSASIPQKYGVSSFFQFCTQGENPRIHTQKNMELLRFYQFWTQKQNQRTPPPPTWSRTCLGFGICNVTETSLNT